MGKFTWFEIIDKWFWPIMGGVLFFCLVFGAFRNIEYNAKIEPKQTCFGQVTILAYTPWDPSNTTWLTASGRSIQPSDYSVAVSKDIESWLGGISNSRVMHIPGYCRPGEWASVNDRSDQTAKTIEVLITAPAGRAAMQERARHWGNKTGTLYKMQTPAGTVAWVEMGK
jgi:hypothetical protein